MIIKIFVSFSPKKTHGPTKKATERNLLKFRLKKFFGVLINKINNVLVLVLVFPSRKVLCVLCI